MLVTSFHLPIPPVPLGHLKAHQTLEGGGGSITSVDFDPSVSGLCPSGVGCPPLSTPGRRGLWHLREHRGCPRSRPWSSYPNPPWATSSSACLLPWAVESSEAAPAPALRPEGRTLPLAGPRFRTSPFHSRVSRAPRYWQLLTIGLPSSGRLGRRSPR